MGDQRMGEEAKAAAKGVEKDEKKEEEEPVSTELGAKDLKTIVGLIEDAYKTKDPRLTYRALRSLVQMRPKLTNSFIGLAIKAAFEAEAANDLLALFPEEKKAEMDVEDDNKEEQAEPTKDKGSDLIDIQIFVKLIATMMLIDQKRLDEAMSLATDLVDTVDSHTALRSLDPLAARAYFYWARCNELLGSYAAIRKRLLVAHRTATLKRNEIGQATLHNLLMRNYLEANLLEQADNFNSKTTFPEVNPNETARHMYYVGRIRIVQLEYSEAFSCLMQATRKAPQTRAPAFRAAVNKLLVIVQLLMGEVPERKFFQQDGLVDDLAPYCALTGAVRLGDLVKFAKVVEEYGPSFQKDRNNNLIVRLRHNVIKAGLRKLNISYSRISLADIKEKLAFDSVKATECIVAKAIRDGVIDGVINHEEGYMQSNEMLNIYTTNEPQEAFKKRIRFCVELHNDTVRAMRYPEDAHKDSFETAEDRLAREKEENELAKTLGDEDEDEM